MNSHRKLSAAIALLIVLGTAATLAYCSTDRELPLAFEQGLWHKKEKMTEIAVEKTRLPEPDNFNVGGLDFSPDGKYLAAVSPSSFEVHVWDWRNHQIVRKLAKIPKGGSSGDATESLRYSPDGQLIANCHSRASGGIVIRVWSVESGEVVRDIATEMGLCRAIGFTPDGKYLVWISDRPKGDQLMVYDTRTWEVAWGLSAAPFYPSTLSISPDGRLIALGGRTVGPGIPIRHQLLVVDVAKRSVVRTIEAFPTSDRFSGEHEIERLAWNPDNIHVAASARLTAGAYGTTGPWPDVIRIFDARSGKRVASEGAYYARFRALRYTPDGKYLIESAIGVSDGTAVSGSKRELLRPDYAERSIQSVVRIWDGRHRILLQEIAGEAGSAAVTQDGRYLALGGDGIIFLFELK